MGGFQRCLIEVQRCFELVDELFAPLHFHTIEFAEPGAAPNPVQSQKVVSDRLLPFLSF